ncbi:60S acidic ribosomal protein [Nitzschia inconspicua]|uniref:60S acidic ribosomal protein n=1 Tax=Nitzschia inconspicua TaxID=303405 RepID=A0A9K3KY83_9STRA|nr:60S acidic ribosomal protein [Nitzschia inconspicua]
MSEVAALLLCKLGGKAGSADDIKAVLEAGGVDVNEDKISALTGDMDGKDINEILAAGMEKMKDVPMGGGGGGGGGGAGGGGAGAETEEAKPAEPEEEEMEVGGGGGDLFGGGDGGGGDY